MNKVRTIASLPLDGGLLCLDFVNTVQTRKKTPSHEYLADYATFLDWCIKVEIVSEDEKRELALLSDASPRNTQVAFQHILQVRDNFYSLFSQKAAGTSVDQSTLDKFNTLVSQALSHIGFANHKDGLKQVWLNMGEDLASPLWKVVKSAYDILTSADAKYIKECSACGWLFLDKTRSHTRRWCNPLECGSTDKAIRYYYKRKAAEGPQPKNLK
ncbi:CGNR zinc finger domain-containing protein [Mucilaginibacter terrenus]|nr:ABATE domain-containing protein [Mucilaginibacter terrenus]